MNRMWLALSIYAALALIEWFTLSDPKIRAVALVILAGLAVRTLAYSRRHPRVDERGNEPDE